MEVHNTQDIEKQQMFLRLYEPVKDKLWRFIRSMIWNKDDAKDLESETIMVAFANIDKLREEGAFLHFLFGIAARIMKQRERRKKLFFLFSKREFTSSEFKDPSVKIDTEILYEALQKLPHKDREIFTLFEISELSMKEIEEIKGMTISAIKNRLWRSRQKLAQYLSAENIPDLKNYSSDEETLPGNNFNIKNIIA